MKIMRSHKYSLEDKPSTAAQTKGDISVHRPRFGDLCGVV